MLINWSRFLPRLALLLLFLVALWWGRNTLIAWQIRSNIAKRTGAAAEIGAVRTDFDNDTIVLTGLRLFDPRRPERELFQAGKGRT